MKRTTALKFKRVMYLLLVLLLIASLVMFTACKKNPTDDGDDGDDDSDEEDTAIVQLIKNGKFDLYNDTSATVFPVTPKDWSYSADSYAGSNAPVTSGDYIRYGIISVKDEFYNADPTKFQTNAMKTKDKDTTLPNPGSKFYDANKPETDEDNNDKILMLENLRPTAAKYKSSAITVPINSYAIISVYVKTVLFNENGDHLTDLRDGQGATIAITGGVDKPIILTGIETSGWNQDNGWKEYQFIIEGSSVSSKTINFELGLGTGSPANSIGYTEGFAFFANSEMKFIPKKDFDKYNTSAAENVIKVVNDGTNYGTYKEKDIKDQSKITRVSCSFKNSNNLNFGNFNNEYLNINNNTDNGDLTIKNITNLNDAEEGLKNELTGYPFTKENITTIQKNNANKSSAGIVSKNFLEVEEGKYYRVSFWLKTSDFDRSGINISLTYAESVLNREGPKYKEFTNINTVTYNLTDDEKEEVSKGLNGNQWDGWREYSFYIDGGIFEHGAQNKFLSLEIWFGPVKLTYEINNDGNAVITNRSISEFKSEGDFPETGSYAMITSFAVEELTRALYNSASSAENVVTGFSLSNKYSASSNYITNGSFNDSQASEAEINNRPTLPSNFTGMYGLGENGLQYAPQGNVTSGIVNTNLWGNYSQSLIALFNNAETAKAALKTLSEQKFNSLLMIFNEKLTSYGYYSSNSTLSASSIYEISVMVKTLDAAKASIYLVDKEGNRLENYVTNSKDKKFSPTSELVYNPYYEEKYDKSSDSYKQDLEYENSAENKLLRKGEKYVVASTIPFENPYYDKNYNKSKPASEKPATWKKETTKYFVYDKAYYKTDTDLYFIIDYDYNQKGEFADKTSASEFTTYTFFVKTGYKTRDIRVELWNGTKYLTPGKDYTATYSKGAVFFDNVLMQTITTDEFYEFVYTGTVDDKTSANTKYFDLSAYERMAEPGTDDASEEEEQPKTEKKPFDWTQLTVIIISSVLLLALGAVAVRMILKKRKKEERTVVEAPAYARKKTSKTKKTDKTEIDDSEFKDKD